MESRRRIRPITRQRQIRDYSMRRRKSSVGPLLWCVICVSGLGCRQYALTTQRDGLVSSVVDVRDIRVLVVNRESECRIRIDQPFTVRAASGELRLRRDRMDWSVIRASPGHGIRFGEHLLGNGVFDVIPQRETGFVQLARRNGRDWAAPRRYPGYLRISVNDRGLVRVINVLDIETYVACVLPGELFPHFEPEAFRAQAVAVRTYALYQMARRASQPYDVTAGASSQVYPGLQSGAAADRARQAANYTRGIVATWTSPVGERIFCTFYSSCCGGMTQDVANCRNDVRSIPPLAGGVRCDCLSVARGKTYQWPAVRLSKSEITTRLVARYPKLKRLGQVKHIQVVQRTPSGRPKVFRLIGSSGEHNDIISEDFRLAMGSNTLRSTNCGIRTERESIVFTDGKGFGHGMGMCQWGMQTMALQGHRAGEILKHYYPTANLTLAYY